MRLFKVLTIALMLFFCTFALYSQAPPPNEEVKQEQAVADGGPTVDPPGPSGTAVPLNSGLLLALLAGGGVVAGLMRKNTTKKD
ncbi:MAG: hypothetical protein PHP99_00755 [Paludibacter sp.]|nr:hypothetical protein [Paludibacter sp.]